MSAWSDLIKRLASGAERSEGRLAADAEDTFAKHLPVRGEEAILPSSPSMVDPLSELSSPSSASAAPNFTMQDSTSLPGMMGHNQAQADYLANQASERASNANANLPSVLGSQAPNAEKGLVPFANKAMVAAPPAVDAEFERIVSGVKDPVTKSLMQKYGRKGLAAAGVGGLGLAGINMMSDDEQPKKAASPALPVQDAKQVPQELNEPLEEASAKPSLSKQVPSAARTPGSESSDEAVKGEVPSNTDALKKLLEIQFGNKTQSSVDNLKKAQAGANRDRAIGETAAAMSEFADAMTGVKGYKSDKGMYERLINGADKQVDQYKDQVAAEKQDASSAYSQGMRDYMKRYGVNISGQASGADLEKIAPQIAQAYEKDQALAQAKDLKEQSMSQHDDDMKYKYDYLKELANSRKDAKNIQLSERQDQVDTKRFDTLSKALTSEIASSRSAFGKAANIKRAADSIDQMVGSADPNNLDNRQIGELARNLDAMLSSGQATIGGMKKLIPETSLGSAAKIEEWLLNQPKGAQQGEFVKRMMDTVHRERDLAGQQIKQTQGKIFGSYKDLQKKHPEKYQELLESHGLVPDDLKYSDRQQQFGSKQEDSSPITIRRKSDGLTKTIPSGDAKKFLDNPAYEKVK